MFLHEIFFGSKIVSSCCDRHRNFDYGCSNYPENEARKVAILAFFDKFWVFFKLLFLFFFAQAFSLGAMLKVRTL